MLGGAFGIAPGAIRDIADRLIAAGLENVGGRLRLPSGEPLGDAVERMRSEVPLYFTSNDEPAPSAPEAPVGAVSRRKRAADRLAKANGDAPPSLDGGSQ